MDKLKNNYLKKLLLVILNSLFFNLLVTSQNLVLNPSFEEYTICPTSSTDFNKCLYWINPTQGGTPDYYAVCSNTVPQHGIYGYQFPLQGENFVGIYLFKNEQLGQPLENIREYVQIKLSNSLSAQNCYLFTMYINLNNQSFFGSNNMGCYFSQNQIYLSSQEGYLFELNPQINSKKIIKDTLGWTKISGVFFPQGGEEYLTIGNFFPDSMTNIEIFNPNDSFQMKSAYYYIDDVSLISIDNLANSMPAYAGEDVLVNPGDSIFIGQEISNLNCTWRTLDGTVLATNTSGIYVQPLETISYVVEQNLCGVVTYDTVKVNVGYVGLQNVNQDDKKVSIYPNPNDGEFYISISENSSNNQLFEIYDMSGKLVYSDNIQFENSGIELLLNLESGIYMFKLTDGETKEQILKKVTISNSK